MQIESSALSELFYDRLRVIRSLQGHGLSEKSTADLIRPVLRFAETELRQHFGDHHYELSVWTTPVAPKIVAYYDSARQEMARTEPNRKASPTFYRDQKYEVIRLLDDPNSESVQYLSRLSKQDYHYFGDQQERIKSSVLYCFDQARPAALVITSNDPNSFQESKRSVTEELVRCLSVAIRAELELLDSSQTTKSFDSNPLVYSWIHVSDIHFGAGSDNHQADHRVVGEALLADVKKIPRLADRILITGDIAFKGAMDEYDTAAIWIRRLAAAAEVSMDRVRLVPGNHDVQRDVTNAELESAVTAVRADPRSIDSQLRQSRKSLRLRLGRYAAFVKRLSPSHPAHQNEWTGDWVENVVCQGGKKRLAIRLAGLSTVWISDKEDGGGGDPAKFIANMALATSQLEMLAFEGALPDLVFVLTHHPPEWLSEPCREELARALTKYECAHFCGHIHKSGASLGRTFGRAKAQFRFSAGAAHDEDPKRNMYRGEHGYSWGAIRLDSKGEWEIGWAPRVYVPSLDEFRADRTRFDLDEVGFSWEKLKTRPLL